MRKPFVAGNWKMNPPTIAEAAALASDVASAVAGIEGASRVVCPPSAALQAVAQALAGRPAQVGAQNMHHEAKGAFTGELPASMLAGICSCVILGHSERRQLFGETDAFVNAKVRAALAAGLTPILCVGETLDERDAGGAEQVVQRQLTAGLEGVGAELADVVVIAYEPVWAIGTGRAATPETAQEMAAAARRQVASLFGSASAAAVRILYGGSVNAANAADIAAQPDVDGALVGGASLVPNDFAAIAQAFASA